MRDAAFLLLKAAQRPQQLLVGAACNTPTAAAASPPAARFKIKDVLTPKMHTACLYLGPRAEHCLHPHQSRNQGATEGIPAPGGRPGGKAGTPQPASLQRPDRRGRRPRPAPGHARPDSPAPHLPDCAPEPRRHHALRPGTPLTPTLGRARSHPRAGTLTDPHPGPGTLSPTFTPRPDPTPTSHPGPARPGPLAPLRRPPQPDLYTQNPPLPGPVAAPPAPSVAKDPYPRGPGRGPPRDRAGATAPASPPSSRPAPPTVRALTRRLRAGRAATAPHPGSHAARELLAALPRRRRPLGARPPPPPLPPPPAQCAATARPPVTSATPRLRPRPRPHGPRRQGTPPRAPCTCAGARHAGSRSPAGGVRCMPGVGSVVALAPPTARVLGTRAVRASPGMLRAKRGTPGPGHPGPGVRRAERGGCWPGDAEALLPVPRSAPRLMMPVRSLLRFFRAPSVRCS